MFSRFDICGFALDLLSGLCLCSCWRSVCVWFKLILCWFLEKTRKSGFELWFCISGFCGLRKRKRKRNEVEGDGIGSTPLVHQWSIGYSLRSCSIEVQHLSWWGCNSCPTFFQQFGGCGSYGLELHQNLSSDLWRIGAKFWDWIVIKNWEWEWVTHRHFFCYVLFDIWLFGYRENNGRNF